MRMLALFLLFGLSSTYGYEYGNTVRAAKNNPYTLAYGLIAAGRPCIIADYEALTPSETVTKEDIQNALMICAFVSDRITKINTRAM